MIKRQRQTVKGVATGSVLLVVVVLALAAVILYLINRDVLAHSRESSDIKKMRALFVGLTLYESLHDDTPPTALSDTARDVGDLDTFSSSGDPFRSGSSFPLDPAFPNSVKRLPYRVSFTYLPEWILNKAYPMAVQANALRNPRVGLIDCYWYGSSANLRPDGLNSDGPVIRLNVDGSAKKLPPIGTGRLLDAAYLFGIQ